LNLPFRDLIDAPSVQDTYLKHKPPDAQFANAKEEVADQPKPAKSIINLSQQLTESKEHTVRLEIFQGASGTGGSNEQTQYCSNLKEYCWSDAMMQLLRH